MMKDRIEESQELEIAERRSYKVYKANEIVQKARYSLNVTELKLLAFCFSMIKPTDKPFTQYSFTIKELCAVCGISTQSLGMYSRIKDLLKGLRDKSFWLTAADGSEDLIGWIGSINIHRGTGRVRLRFDDVLQDYIMGLYGNYTQYELLSILPMKHAASIRIYELLKSYSYNHDQVDYDMDTLRKKLGYDNSAYEQFKAFRRRCLEPAMQEINQFTDLDVSYTTVKKGRKVTGLIFSITHKDDASRYIASVDAEEALQKPKEDIETGQMHITDYKEMLP